MPRIVESSVARARDIALKELPMWPSGYRLRLSPLSTDDKQVFVVESPPGEVRGTIIVHSDGSVSTSKPPES